MQELIKYLQVVENSQNLDKLEMEEKNPKALVIENGSKDDQQRKNDGKNDNSGNKRQ